MTGQALPTLSGFPIESLSSTTTQNEFGSVLDRVIRGTVIAVTKHRKASAVLLPVELYQQLLAERSDSLASLRDRFDERFDQMQTPGAKAAVKALFAAGPTELGRAASVKGGRKRG